MRFTAMISMALMMSSTGLAQNYTVEDLGSLGGTHIFPSDINADGHVCGQAQDSSGPYYHSFLWDGSTLSALDIYGGIGNHGYGINDDGDIVGEHGFSSTDIDAYLWQGFGGGVTYLPSLNGSSQAHDINNNNEIVGMSENAAGNIRAVLWTKSGGNWQVSNLGTLGNDTISSANAINDAGEVVGYSGSSNRAFLWDGSMQNLGDLGGGRAHAIGLNDNTHVVGWSATSGNDTHGFEWVNGTMSALAPVVSMADSMAFDINNHNHAVGFSYDNTINDTATLWQSGTALDLNQLAVTAGWELSHAHAINDAGEVTGYGQINGENHAFKLIPNLALSLPSPGEAGVTNDFVMYGCTPGSSVELYGGTQAGPGVGNIICPGLFIQISDGVRIDTATCGSDGIAHFSVDVPGSVSGQTVLLQSWELSSCRISSRLSYEFP